MTEGLCLSVPLANSPDSGRFRYARGGIKLSSSTFLCFCKSRMRQSAVLITSLLCRLPPKTVLEKQDASLALELTAGSLKPLLLTFQHRNCQLCTAC